MIKHVMRTRDGRWRVYVHHDQRADLADEYGRIVLGSVLLFEVTDRLAQMGISPDDLVPD